MDIREDIIKFADSILKISQGQRFDDPNLALNYLLALGEGWVQVGEGVWEVIIEGENYQLDIQGILDRANIGYSYYGETTPQPQFTSEVPQGQPTYQGQPTNQTQTFQPGGQVGGQTGVNF